jgi:hypothetical protein
MSFKVKDQITILTSESKIIEGTVASIIDGKVYSIKFLNDKNEQDMHWLNPNDYILIDDPGIISTSNDVITIPGPAYQDTSASSLRFNTGKPQAREVDPNFILGISEVLTKSRDKYPEMNWSLPTKYSTPYDSALRHIMAFWSGEDFDKETNKHHLLHAATNLMFLYFHTRQENPGADDRGFKGKK